MAQRPRDMMFPGLDFRDLQTLRKAKGDEDAMQAAVNAIVRAGCSVERMQSMLKRIGLKEADIKAFTDEAYPEAPAAPAKAAAKAG